MERSKLLAIIKDRIADILKAQDEESRELWREFLELHPADIAEFLATFDTQTLSRLFLALPHSLGTVVFDYFSDPMKVALLRSFDDARLVLLFQAIPADELTDLFDELSDQELEKYLRLIHKKEREKIISLLQFKPDCAGGIMDMDIFSLGDDFTVGKSVKILQRLQPQYDLHRLIFVTDRSQKLVGHIRLEDLVLEKPEVILRSILRKNELVVSAQEDKEEIAQKMVHYQVTIVPVVDAHNTFLGVVPAKTLVEIIEEEASEDVYRMSALVPIKEPYFEAPFLRLFYERSSILIVLFLAQSLSMLIMEANEALLGAFLWYFVPALSSTGGNTSGQTSALVIQGLASGDIKPEKNVARFLRREFVMAFAIATVMAFFAFIRVFVLYGKLAESIAISCSLFFIVLASVIFGSLIPLGLKRFNIDPAFSAGPVLATLMDVLGIFIYCFVSKIILSSIS